MKIILQITLLSLFVWSCSEKIDDQGPFKYDTEVIAVFTPNGIGDQTNAGLIYTGIVRTTDSLGISFRPIFPVSYEDGAKTIAKLASGNQKGVKRLIISTDPEYSNHLRNAASDGLIMDSDSTKLLVLDGGFTHPAVYTAYVPFYGLMYEAGYVAGKMSDVNNVRIYLANDTYRYMREGRDGFIDGFSRNNKNHVDVVDFSLINDSDTEGFLKRTSAYLYSAPECSESYDMVLPICGETIMGFLRYNREHPGSFYTIGIDTDMSIYSSDVPFSCVEHLDRILSECITDWMGNRLKHYRKFGLEDQWIELVISKNYKSLLEPFAKEIHEQAIKMESAYAK